MNNIYFNNLLFSADYSKDFKTSQSASVSKSSGREEDFKVKYKTEICRNWEMGACEFGSGCAFAHGYEELRYKSNTGKNYKTKKCKQFHEIGYCIYGNRCQFKHRKTSLDTAPSSPKSNPHSSRKSSEDSNKKRLQIFIDIQKKGENP
jgi:Zinc finger C-x8-C-x5-C-x3-H type (and similar)